MSVYAHRVVYLKSIACMSTFSISIFVTPPLIVVRSVSTLEILSVELVARNCCGCHPAIKMRRNFRISIVVAGTEDVCELIHCN